MKKVIVKNLMVVGVVLTIVGCGSSGGDGNNQGNGDNGELPAAVIDAIFGPMSTLSQDLKDSITYIYSEEGLAYDVYLNIYNIQYTSSKSITKHRNKSRGKTYRCS